MSTFFPRSEPHRIFHGWYGMMSTRSLRCAEPQGDATQEPQASLSLTCSAETKLRSRPGSSYTHRTSPLPCVLFSSRRAELGFQAETGGQGKRVVEWDGVCPISATQSGYRWKFCLYHLFALACGIFGDVGRTTCGYRESFDRQIAFGIFIRATTSKHRSRLMSRKLDNGACHANVVRVFIRYSKQAA
ncbi:hypothetical protein P280DRAFT_164999 [Massarina eburnea CBS 473.64]|uniref:Uncharacterized protein n=1 Tax=Massarina eburnea CBS 473.64 TaxID=1395130 RepID=A0A6A6RKG6_9PLEO|nr:hypothetical protein P280DRAFT_164999 [Massarina eburnea CBS 473.64]